jgi:hypothetical protein
MSPPLTDPTSALLRAIRLNLHGFSGLVVEEITSRSWASVTFNGARHELAFRLEGPGAEQAADRFLANLDVAEFELRGHVLADIVLVSEDRRPGCVRIGLEALTVEDR